MPERLIINGDGRIKGNIEVRGSKNAATPMIAASLLSDKPCTISNLPLIDDVYKMIKLIESMGAKVSWKEERTIEIDAGDIDPDKLDQELVAQMRSSVLLISPLLARFGKLRIRHPGGCVIGSRSIKTHLEFLKKMGARVYLEEVGQKELNNGELVKKADLYHFEAEEGLRGGEIILDEFSVTATENALMAASLAKGETTIKIAASEPHVSNLALFLKKMGAQITGEGTHSMRVKGRDILKGANHGVIYDYLEAGTFTLIGLVSRGEVEIENVPINDLDLFFSMLKKGGGDIKFLSEDRIRVKGKKKMVLEKIQTMPYPGIPTDLQSPLGVLATQTQGLTLIHDPLYEGRLKYLEELNKMGAEIVMCDPHRAIINGPTTLQGTNLDPLDLRSGAALIMAGIIAQGTTIIRDVSQADRGYERIEERLQKIGVDVRRFKE